MLQLRASLLKGQNFCRNTTETGEDGVRAALLLALTWASKTFVGALWAIFLRAFSGLCLPICRVLKRIQQTGQVQTFTRVMSWSQDYRRSSFPYFDSEHQRFGPSWYLPPLCCKSCLQSLSMRAGTLQITLSGPFNPAALRELLQFGADEHH